MEAKALQHLPPELLVQYQELLTEALARFRTYGRGCSHCGGTEWEPGSVVSLYGHSLLVEPEPARRTVALMVSCAQCNTITWIKLGTGVVPALTTGG